MPDYDPNLWRDDQKKRDAIRAIWVLQTGIPYTKQSDHGSGETCAQVIIRLCGSQFNTAHAVSVYRGQEALKQSEGMIRALRSGIGWNAQSADHADATEPCVKTISRIAGIPF